MNNTDWFYPKLADKDSRLTNFNYPTSKVVCVGRNYVEHARELNNPVPKSPLFFIKPNSSVVEIEQEISHHFNDSPCHYELEIAILVGNKIQTIDEQSAIHAIAGVGLGLDLTLREVQQELKNKKHPWEKAKAFDNSCPVTHFIPIEQFSDLSNINFELMINQKIKQTANSQQMIFNIPRLIAEASRSFTLLPGDILLTGTPSGVGVLEPADQLLLSLETYQWQTSVKS